MTLLIYDNKHAEEHFIKPLKRIEIVDADFIIAGIQQVLLQHNATKMNETLQILKVM